MMTKNRTVRTMIQGISMLKGCFHIFFINTSNWQAQNLQDLLRFSRMHDLFSSDPPVARLSFLQW